MTDRAELIELAKRLQTAAPAGSEVILFGSYARGDAGPDSDIDFLVIEPEVADRWSEAIRLRRALKGATVGIDILVTTRQEYEKWHQTPANVFYAIEKEGRRFEAVT